MNGLGTTQHKTQSVEAGRLPSLQFRRGIGPNGLLPEDAPTLSTVVHSQPSHPKDRRGSMTTTASGSRSRQEVGLSNNSTQTAKDSVTPPYSAKPAYGDDSSIHQSLRSATPFSQKSIGSVLPHASWHEGVEEDLVTHLEPREQFRQEALWEIVVSEERYGSYRCLLN